MLYHCCSLIGALCVDPVIDWSVCVSVRLQLHLSPGVWGAGPAGLQPERQQPTGNSISQKTLLHASSLQGETDLELSESGVYLSSGVLCSEGCCRSQAVWQDAAGHVGCKALDVQAHRKSMQQSRTHTHTLRRQRHNIHSITIDFPLLIHYCERKAMLCRVRRWPSVPLAFIFPTVYLAVILAVPLSVMVCVLVFGMWFSVDSFCWVWGCYLTNRWSSWSNVFLFTLSEPHSPVSLSLSLTHLESKCSLSTYFMPLTSVTHSAHPLLFSPPLLSTPVSPHLLRPVPLPRGAYAQSLA